MNSKPLNWVAALILATGSIAAYAECTYPKGARCCAKRATASEAEMVAAMTAFKIYDAEVRAYGACLEQETKDKAAGTAQLM
jgi:hypothetical protein